MRILLRNLAVMRQSETGLYDMGRHKKTNPDSFLGIKSSEETPRIRLAKGEQRNSTAEERIPAIKEATNNTYNYINVHRKEQEQRQGTKR